MAAPAATDWIDAKRASSGLPHRLGLDGIATQTVPHDPVVFLIRNRPLHPMPKNSLCHAASVQLPERTGLVVELHDDLV
jgi:hypothetical protein